MAAALKRHRLRQMEDRMAAGEAWTETGLVVVTATGRPVPPWKLTDRFRELAAEIGLEPIRLHDGRHCANSLWREAGIDSTVRQVWGGWPDLAMPDVTYNHVRPAAHTEAARKAAAYWARVTDL